MTDGNTQIPIDYKTQAIVNRLEHSNKPTTAPVGPRLLVRDYGPESKPFKAHYMLKLQQTRYHEEHIEALREENIESVA